MQLDQTDGTPALQNEFVCAQDTCACKPNVMFQPSHSNDTRHKKALMPSVGHRSQVDFGYCFLDTLSFSTDRLHCRCEAHVEDSEQSHVPLQNNCSDHRPRKLHNVFAVATTL